MKFGKISNPQVDDLIFSDDYTVLFSNEDRRLPFEFRFGLSKWGNPDWKGKFYPSKLTTKDFLSHYASLFSTVEVNATYYRIFKCEVAQAWNKSVQHNSNFKFVLKVPASLSGLSEPRKYQRILDDWFFMIDAMKDSYGACFILFNGRPGDNALRFVDQLHHFWDKDVRLHLEIRHPEWFEKPVVLENLMLQLAALEIGMVITDSPGRQDVKHHFITTPNVIIRYVGYDLTPIDIVRIEYWRKTLVNWEKSGVGQSYFLFHNPSPEKSMLMGRTLI